MKMGTFFVVQRCLRYGIHMIVLNKHMHFVCKTSTVEYHFGHSPLSINYILRMRSLFDYQNLYYFGFEIIKIVLGYMLHIGMHIILFISCPRTES